MILGEGARKVGEACWSHAQCTRSQTNAHCHALICTCDSGFHNHSGRCSRNIWEDLGLAPWELILVSLVFTLLGFAIFVGCMYFVISKALRISKTGPSEGLSPTSSFKEQQSIKKKGDEESFGNVAKIYQTKLVNDSTVESHLVEEGEVMFSNDNISTASTLTFEPVRFITPLDYRSSDSASTAQSSRRSSSSQVGLLSTSSKGLLGNRFKRAWSTTTGTTLDDSDEWFMPNRNHTRSQGPQSPAGTSRLPLLLRSSTFSESDESP